MVQEKSKNRPRGGGSLIFATSCQKGTVFCDLLHNFAKMRDYGQLFFWVLLASLFAEYAMLQCKKKRGGGCFSCLI
jgi:hypothetical protein